jgi:hypothetical protein
MSPDTLRKRQLECARLAADCQNLANDVGDPALQKHYRRMAEVWSKLAFPRDLDTRDPGTNNLACSK